MHDGKYRRKEFFSRTGENYVDPRILFFAITALCDKLSFTTLLFHIDFLRTHLIDKHFSFILKYKPEYPIKRIHHVSHFSIQGCTKIQSGDRFTPRSVNRERKTINLVHPSEKKREKEVSFDQL